MTPKQTKQKLATQDDFDRTVSRIVSCEEKRETAAARSAAAETVKQRVLLGIVLLGIFSILAGIGLIIAANWDVIPVVVKVLGGIACLGGSLAAMLHFYFKGKQNWMEAFLLISYFLIAGNIALIQQAYHLYIAWNEGCLFWGLLSVPLLFLTRIKILYYITAGLLVFGVWDIMERLLRGVHYMAVVGALFLIMMLGTIMKGQAGTVIRRMSFVGAIILLYGGDTMSESIVGLVTTTLFLVLLARFSPHADQVKWYNTLFCFAAWRIVLLFWNAYYNLNNMGLMLIVFGVVILSGAGSYYYFYDKIQAQIRRLIDDQ